VTKLTSVRGKSNKYVVAGATASTALMAAHSVIPAVVFAANQYDWIRQDSIELSGGAQFAITAMSASGSHLMVSGGESNPGLHVSVNSGTTWENVAEEMDPGNIGKWAAIDVSNDGQTMVAASEDTYDGELGTVEGKIFISTNAGDSWSDVSPAGTDDWSDIVVSGDGTTIAAVTVGSGNVYISENDGADWTTSAYDTDASRGKNIAISDNGEKLLVGGENDVNPYTHLYLSENAGDSWAEIDPNAGDEIHTMSPAISADGSTIAVATTGYAGDGNDAIFISENDGADWSDVWPNDEIILSGWSDLSMSDDGTTLVAVDYSNSKMHISNDTGVNWNEENPGEAYEDEQYWVAADLNTDGSKIIAVSEDAAFLNFAGDAITEPVVTLDNAENGKTITITTPEGTTITCSSAVKESGLDAQDGSYTYPLGLVDFCFSGAETNNEVTLLFVTDLKPDEVLVRKYNPTNDEYATVSEASVTETTYEGKNALLVSYNIVDNGPLDLDPDVSEVADPVGLAVADSANEALADTGDNASTARLVAIGLLGLGPALILRKRKQTIRSK
jgi:photosystem II stability/assembly factor-like uncharacterized protein